VSEPRNGKIPFSIVCDGYKACIGRSPKPANTTTEMILDRKPTEKLFDLPGRVSKEAEDYDLVRQFAIALSPPGAAIRLAPEVK
jgi:hypothetical protein